ncbi:MAG TPA: PAS domain-containing sensor histidine kinase [Solirubrobacteraceae bacterium]|nr:PAS domain-containing sensor histidine kinase [Solirubrobacteraceae bacterium]
MTRTANERDADRLSVEEMRDELRELREQVRLYEAALGTGPVFVHIYDEEMNSRWSTASLRPELGHQPSAPQSRDEALALLHPDDRRESERRRQGLLRGEPYAPRRVRVRDAEGKWRWLAIMAASLLDDPDIGGIVVHAWDVSEMVEREEEVDASRRMLASLIDTLDEGVVVVSEGSVAFANAEISRLFPAAGDHQELIGRSSEELHDVFAQQMVDPGGFLESGRRIVSAGEAVRGRLVETADRRIFEQNFLPIHVGGRLTSRMWVYRDVTAQRQFERRQTRLLEMERKARRSAEQQNDRLRELDDLKTMFVATVSHELRTPLSAVRSYIDLLVDPEGEPLTEEQRRIASAVQRGALRLGRLVDDLLVLARLQSRSLQMERNSVDVRVAVADAVDEVRRSVAGEVSISAELSSGPAIETDRVRLVQIVSNLVVNAAKFARGKVSCSARPEAESWVIEVTDDGPGIAPDELEHIFEPFYRGRSRGGDGRPGTGLGLAISAQIAELLGGSLQLTNGAGGGAVARLSLPITSRTSDDARD